MAPTALFIGGTGIISAACVREAVGLGYRVSVLNRGRNSLRPVPDGVEVIHADLDDTSSVASALSGRTFDVVADFMSFTLDRLQRNVELFTGRAGQYIFISSASAYAKPVASLPIRESTPLRNPFWQYSRDKIACEDFLVQRYREDGFPVTIVRPSHTYDQFALPIHGNWTQIARMRAGKPACCTRNRRSGQICDNPAPVIRSLSCRFRVTISERCDRSTGGVREIGAPRADPYASAHTDSDRGALYRASDICSGVGVASPVRR